MSLGLFHDTIAAQSTAEGRSALAIVRVSGSDAIRICGSLLRSPERLWVAPGGASIYDEIPLGDRVVDDIVIHVFRSPRSFTGEDLCEITCHGSAVIVRQILELLTRKGARLAEPGEFSRRAFFNDKIDLAEAELISARINASSTAELRGTELALALKAARLREIYDAVLTLIASIDAQIDFGESDHVEIEDFDDRLASVSANLQSLLTQSSTRSANSGTLSLALTGPPNVGKSSLFNALLRYERSIVSEMPGTTRDYVEAFLEIDGVRVKLVDTAGIRDAIESTESQGIAMGQAVSRDADIAFRVTDPECRNPSGYEDRDLLHNKCDLDGWSEGLAVSALTGQGLAFLHARLFEEVHRKSSEFSLIRLSEHEQLTIVAALDKLGKLEHSDPALLADDLRSVVASIGRLLGLQVGEESLNYIFSQMCIGK